jgi:hypothetical protein
VHTGTLPTECPERLRANSPIESTRFGALQARLGSKMAIRYSGRVDRCSILHPSAVSHTNNMGQRLVLLKTLSTAKGVITVLLPTQQLVAPSGHWMLFCSNKGEDFSEATWLELLP